jgi:hypothetical protein
MASCCPPLSRGSGASYRPPDPTMRKGGNDAESSAYPRARAARVSCGGPRERRLHRPSLTGDQGRRLELGRRPRPPLVGPTVRPARRRRRSCRSSSRGRLRALPGRRGRGKRGSASAVAGNRRGTGRARTGPRSSRSGVRWRAGTRCAPCTGSPSCTRLAPSGRAAAGGRSPGRARRTRRRRGGRPWSRRPAAAAGLA